MPSSSSLPDSAPPPQNPSAAGASHFDRMEAELKVLQQQAQATQQSLQQLQTRTSVDPVSALVSDMPGLANVNSAMLGVGSALVLASVAAWWYMWQRPRTRWIDAPRTAVPRQAPPISARVPLSETGGPTLYAPGNSTQPPSAALPEDALAWDTNMGSGDTTQPFDPSSPFARQDPNMAFDSEAAANEVMRVRKSLAEKREARAYLLEREDGNPPPPPAHDPDAELDLDLDLDEPAPPSAHAWLEPPAAEEEPAQPVVQTAPTSAETDAALDLDLGLDPWRQPGETLPGSKTDALAEAIHLSFTLEDYGMTPAAPATPAVPAPAAPTQPEHAMDQPPEAHANAADDLDLGLEPSPELELALEPVQAAEPTPVAVELPVEPEADPDHPHHEAGSKTYDFTITMALAHESAALELWPEARDLATEVLESDDPALVSEALSLLERLNHLELNAPPDTNWNTMR